MTSNKVFNLSCDAKAWKIIHLIPKGLRSQTIRGWIDECAPRDGYDVTAPRGRGKTVTGDQAITDQLREMRDG